jgi:hypothetical protein
METICLDISTDTLSTYFMLERTYKLQCILRVYHSSLSAMAQRRLLEPTTRSAHACDDLPNVEKEVSWVKLVCTVDPLK